MKAKNLLTTKRIAERPIKAYAVVVGGHPESFCRTRTGARIIAKRIRYTMVHYRATELVTIVKLVQDRGLRSKIS